ncbi:9595_t:CDS:2, partial [Gigaspora margarita]
HEDHEENVKHPNIRTKSTIASKNVEWLPIIAPIPQMRNIKPLEKLHDCKQKCETASHGPIPQPFEQKYNTAAINIKTKILHKNNDHYEQK